MKLLLRLLLLTAPVILSCERGDSPSIFPSGEGFLILNEGNYRAGNGSISFYSTESKNIHNYLFNAVNERALGDIPSFIAVDGTTGFIIVNNSGTVEVVNMITLESLGTITGLDSPRQMVIHGRKGYISSLTSNEVTVLDLDDMDISGNVDIGCSSESMVIVDGKLFTANWSGGNEIVVTDIGTGEAITSVSVGLEPESMVLDRDNKLWVLCTGGWNGEEIPRIVKINTSTYGKEAEMFFRAATDNPSSLVINTAGDTLYYLDEGIRRMPVTSSVLPSDAFIPSGDRLFYKLAPGSGGLLGVTDAIDYQQRGDFLLYNSHGELLDNEQAGIIPGFMLFMQE